jgi:ATP-binding cassette subfamily F protein 3
MLELRNISHAYTYGEEIVLQEATFTLGEKDRLGLIGPNGCGKTTLVRILMGELEPFSGQVIRPRKAPRIGYLPQESGKGSEGTLWEEMLSVFAQLVVLEERLVEVEAEYVREPSEGRKLALEKLKTTFVRMGGLTYKDKIKDMLSGLGFHASEHTLRLSQLSSGQRTKAHLAKVLLEQPDMLLLDEPTNHLDLESQEWLERRLAGYPGSVLVVSHDRWFLDQVVRETAELRNGRLTLYKGNYAFYRAEKEEHERLAWEAYEAQRRKVRKMEQEIRQRKVWSQRKEKEKIGAGGAKGHITHVAAKMAKRAKAVESRLDHMLEKERADRPFWEPPIKLRFPELPECSRLVLNVKELTKTYGQKPLFKDLSFDVLRGEKVALIGANGSGKSTLLKIVLGQIQPDSGCARIGFNVAYGYYPQELEELGPGITALDEVRKSGATQLEARTFLGAMKLRREEVLKKCREFSRGEQAKITIARLLLSRTNFLILDEPMNHLDIEAREALEGALAQHPGTILFVSHDRYLLKRLATKVVALMDGQAVVYLGNYRDYLERRMYESPVTSHSFLINEAS